MKKSENMRELEYLASSQWGMFTAAQAHVLGVGRTQISRMLGAGTVEFMRRGVYRYVIGEETSYSFIKAAWLSVYPKHTVQERLRERPIDAVVAGVTAAYLHGIGNLYEDPYTFVVRKRRQTVMHDLVFHMWPIEESDVTFVKTVPVTTMERTVADLVRERCDPDHVIQTAIDAVRKGTRVSRICECLNMLEPRYQEVASIIETSIVSLAGLER